MKIQRSLHVYRNAKEEMEFLIEPVIFSSVVKIGPEKIAPIAIFSVRSRKLAASVCIWQKNTCTSSS